MNDKDWQPHEPVSRTQYVVNLERKVEELEEALEETEHDMHMREHVKNIEAERDALAEKLRIKERTIDLMGQFTEKLQKELDDLQGNFDKQLKEALANSDACWKLEQKMYVRQRDEARAEVEQLRRWLNEARAGE